MRKMRREMCSIKCATTGWHDGKHASTHMQHFYLSAVKIRNKIIGNINTVNALRTAVATAIQDFSRKKQKIGHFQ